MSTAELLGQLKQLSNAERLVVIEAATRLVREDLAASEADPRTEQERRLRDAATRLADLYQPGGELTEWTALDGEDFANGHLQR